MFLISTEQIQKQFEEMAKQAIDTALNNKINEKPITVYRREDIAEIFKTSIQWVSIAVKKKMIPEPYKKGNVVYWTHEQVLDMIKN